LAASSLTRSAYLSVFRECSHELMPGLIIAICNSKDCDHSTSCWQFLETDRYHIQFSETHICTSRHTSTQETEMTASEMTEPSMDWPTYQSTDLSHTNSFYMGPYLESLSGLVVSMLASGNQECGFALGRSRRIFRAKKSSACLPSEAVAPCRRFAACQRSLNGIKKVSFRQNYRTILANSSTFRY
jgi:hypothetical protein